MKATSPDAPQTDPIPTALPLLGATGATPAATTVLPHAPDAGRPDIPAPPPSAPSCEQNFRGIPAAEGIAIGRAYRASEPEAAFAPRRIAASDIEAERARMDAAVVQSRRQVAKLRARLQALPDDSQAEIAPLLDAYLHMLGPSRLLRGALRRIADGLVSAETAVSQEADIIAAFFAATEDGARQAEEVREVARRLVRNLVRAPFRSLSNLPKGAILVAETLRPADAALIDPSRVAGVATDEGGTNGHAAIMLRALGVPAVLGAPGLSAAVRAGDLMVVDGSDGRVVLHPQADTLAAARRQAVSDARERQRLAKLRRLPAETLDGERVELQANLELPAELPLLTRAGAHGIGLLRSEFLFMNRDTLPSEDEQAETYRTVVEAMAGDMVTIRVLDWGGEKEIDALGIAGVVPETPDVNPALGLRGIRLLLRERELFATQLAAILRAAVAGPVRVMLPMVTCVAEVRAAKEIYRGVAAQLRARGARLPASLPPLGIMVETPGAALAADALATEAEFFAIGTNDLAMYALAVDRGETEVAHLYDPLHPAVLRLVQFATEAANRRGIPVSVCGEMAGNPRYLPLLLGLGLRRFSMNAAALPRIKRTIRGTTVEDCVRLAWAVMQEPDRDRIEALVTGFGT